MNDFEEVNLFNLFHVNTLFFILVQEKNNELMFFLSSFLITICSAGILHFNITHT